MELAQIPRVLGRTPPSYSSLGDEELVRAVSKGNHAAFEALYDRHCSGMLSLARQMLSSPAEAEDVVQHAFMSAYRELVSGVRPTYPRAWLYAIVRNRCLTVLRDRREVADEAHEPSTVGLAEEVERRSDLRDLLESMQRLPEEQRTALALFELGGLSQTEIGQVMGCDSDRVKALVHQARTNLAHTRAAREAPCESVREQLAVLRGGRLNTRELRTHVRDCSGCAEYALTVREQRRRLAIVLPVIPLLAAKAPAIAGGSGVAGATVGASVGRKVAAWRPRPSVAAAAAATTGVVAAGAMAAAVIGGGGDEPRQDPKPAAVVASGPAAAVAAAPPPKAAPASASKPSRAASRRAAARRRAAAARKKKRAAAARARARATAPAAASPAPTSPASEPEPSAPATPVASSPAPSPSPSPAPSPSPSPAPEPTGEDFNLPDPGPPPAAGQEP